MGVLEEENSAVVEVSWLLPSGPASSSLNIHSGFSCHTPAADMIEGTWVGIFYLMDVFHVVYKVICAPPPTLLV